MAKQADRRRKCSLQVVAVDQLFEDLAMGSSRGATAWRPPTDVFESEEAFIVRMAISGLRHGPDGRIQNAQVVVEDDVLTVRGCRHENCPHQKYKFYQMEIHYGYFECHVRIHAAFDRDGVKAQYRDGFLEIFIPKTDSRRGRSGTHRIAVEY
jgi:HSP20 family protein